MWTPVFLSVLSVASASPIRERAPASQWTSLGCVADSNTRVLADRVYIGERNSVDFCLDTCESKGYPYAGVEYGTECWCGDALNLGATADASKCSMKCPGDSAQKCGAAHFMNLYRSEDSETETSGNHQYEHVGCYRDQSQRTLPYELVRRSAMTQLSCINHCRSKDYALAGLENGNECFCGDNYGSAAGVDGCSVKCAGDAQQTCGGAWQVDIWRTGFTGSRNNSHIATTDHIGCYRDQKVRTLADAFKVSPTMTQASCISHCASKGYALAGLENGRECYCGNSYGTAASVDGCRAPCAGDSRSTCGGAWEVDIWKTGETGNTGGDDDDDDEDDDDDDPIIVDGEVVISANAKTLFQNTQPAIVGKGPRYLWAHFMVGLTYSYTREDWAADMNAATEAGFDGFALNMGREVWEPKSVADAYAAAQGKGFKLFFSFDMSSLPCASAADADRLVNLTATHAKSPAQATYQEKVLVSTFSGGACTFGQASAQAGWGYFRAALQKRGVPLYLVPAHFSALATFAAESWFDGALDWNGAWPPAAADLDTGRDEAYLAALGAGRGYMAGVSPFFFTYYGADSWAKNWLYRSDNWLLATRWEALLALRDRFAHMEFVSWNDFGESHYLAAPGADQPGSQAWTDGMPHTGLSSLVRYYADAWHKGAYPIPTDRIWAWSRPHPKGAVPSAPKLERPRGADATDDNAYAMVLLAAPAEVVLESGKNKATFRLPRGMNKIAIASAEGPIVVQIVRAGKVLKTLNTTGHFSYTNKPVDYNFNYYVQDA